MFLAILCQYVHLIRRKAVSWAYMVPGKTGRGLRSEGWIPGFDSGADEEQKEESFVCSSPFCCYSPLLFLASSSFALRSRSAKAFAPVSIVSLLGKSSVGAHTETSEGSRRLVRCKDVGTVFVGHSDGGYVGRQ